MTGEAVDEDRPSAGRERDDLDCIVDGLTALAEQRIEWQSSQREFEARFRSVAENSPDHLSILDNHYQIQYMKVPPAGFIREQVIGTSLFDYLPAEYHSLARAVFDTVIHTGQPGQYELQSSRPDGTVSQLSTRAFPIVESGQVTGIMLVTADITGQKQAEDALRASEEIARAFQDKLKTLHEINIELSKADSLDDLCHLAVELGTSRLDFDRLGLFLYDADAQTMVGTYGIDRHGQVKAISEIRLRYDPEKSRLTEQILLKKGQTFVWEDQALFDGDQAVGHGWNASAALWREDEPIGWLVADNLFGQQPLEPNQLELLKLYSVAIGHLISRQRTEETVRKLNEELEQRVIERTAELRAVNEEIRNSAYIISHDLRNPLSIVFSYTGILRKTVWDQLTEKQRKYIESIDNAARQMKSITTDFLSLVRIEETALGKLQGQKINLVDLVHSVFVDFCVQAEHKNQTFRLSSPETPMPVQGHKAELQQAVTNLVGNALKYTPADGTIEVSLRQQNAIARFEVVDSGHGIPEEQQDKLFQPFFRVQSAETESIEGTGLGLYLVSKIVEHHGGRLIFLSKPGSGSTFGFELPLLLE
jgi:PAS domain S-box-containing protein